ncbi:hypothetical protein NSPZN2_30282 [Nitrospira defluvii]|uniref:Uncharacterized protein n=1 Tax=Nitrospira defluvii TaxID=330214 RepID=A0ABM8RHD8_9BACT|nr:hypothetical protein NSPZN2_30282 [Nitrospira defluvii]
MALGFIWGWATSHQMSLGAGPRPGLRLVQHAGHFLESSEVIKRMIKRKNGEPFAKSTCYRNTT